MKETTKKHIISALVTFFSTFLIILGTQLAEGLPVQLTTNFFIGLLFVAGRGGMKAVSEQLFMKK